jgi:hypothetical protein
MELDGGLHPRPTLVVEDLDVYERRGDGHTILRHCEITPHEEAKRLAQHPWLAATGSFPEVSTAQRCVEACVGANRTTVERWLRGGLPRLAIRVDMHTVVGDELQRTGWEAGEPPRPVTGVRAVLARNPNYRSGFAVLTAYPVTAAASEYPPRR